MLRCVLGTNLMPDTKLNFQKLHSSLVYYFSMPFRNTLECMMSFYINVRELLSIFIPLSLEKFSKFFINNISVKNYVTHSLWKCIFVFQNKNIKWINNNNDYFLLALKKMFALIQLGSLVGGGNNTYTWTFAESFWWGLMTLTSVGIKIFV